MLFPLGLSQAVVRVNLEVQVKLDARFNLKKWCEILGGSSNDRVCPGPKRWVRPGKKSGIKEKSTKRLGSYVKVHKEWVTNGLITDSK